jgi:type II secretory pathway predicted ATPase ExeA
LSEVFLSFEWLNLKSESLLKHFGLTREPFKITPDPSFLYLSASHQQALGRLVYGISARKGFIVLTGEVGTGKTTLLHCLLRELKKRNTQSTLIVNTIEQSKDLLRDVCEDLGFTAFREDRQDVHTYLKLLNQLLLESYHKGKNVTLIIDEAQNLSTEVLENIRLLSNFETAEDKLLQIVLAGQPELAERLNEPELRQLKQRIVLYHYLKPLNYGECAEYVTSRLETAGATRSIFTSEALEAIYSYSGGIPRLVNILCDNGLMTAYGSGVKRVRAVMIREIAEERALTPQAEEPERIRAVASMGFERQTQYAAPSPGGRRVKRLGRIVDDEVEPQYSPAVETPGEEFTVFTVGATTDEPRAKEPGEAAMQESVESTAPGDDRADDRTEEVEAQFQVAPSVTEFTVFTAGAVPGDPPGVVETTEIELEKDFGPAASGIGLPEDSVAEVMMEEYRIDEASAGAFTVYARKKSADEPAFLKKEKSNVVSAKVLGSLIGALTEAMGPMAPLVVRDQAAALGERLDAFPKSRLAELVESASREILEEPLRLGFERTMSEEIETMNLIEEKK